MDKFEQAYIAVQTHGSFRKAAAFLGEAPSTIQNRVARFHKKAEFEITAPLPSKVAPAEELVERRKAEFARVDAAYKARHLIPVRIKLDGPIGISHFGDPHIDDPGTDIAKLERHLTVVRDTPGMFGANVGDLQNLWIGRLARLYGEQSTSAQESWVLAEWLLEYIEWLYLIGGNHDCWAGPGNPVQWIMRDQQGVSEDHGARLNLIFPNGREVRINARHDFKGSSQFNTAHGAAKAAMLGWRDHILTCGHTHVSGYNIVVDPASGLMSHALRVAAYKTHDRFAHQLGLPNQNFSENAVTIINPAAREENGLVTVIWNVEEAAEYLSWLRHRHSVSRRAT